MIRRALPFAALLTCALMMTACSTGPRAGSDDLSPAVATVDPHAYPVTIGDHFGSTTIRTVPKRVVALGVNDPDNLLALGVVPVGIGKVSWGGNAHGTTPWFDAELHRLGARQPKILDQTDAIPYDDIAGLTPDLILATNSGLTRQQYDKLSKIAPVVAYPNNPWTTTWQQSLKMDGRAVGRSTRAATVRAQADAELASARTRFPAIQGKTFIWAALATTDLSQVPFYTPADARPVFLTSIGMRNAPVVKKLSPKGAFYTQVSAERAAELKSDVFLTYAVKRSDARTYADNKLIGQIPAVKSGHMFASTDNTAALAAGVPTPLSIPYALGHFVPNVEKAAEGR